ncbi:MAG TPA: hypothetical protein VKF36_17685 [Syntrophorhabdales bacterium]|nr:hypothetical protein [Syntrophorhabdales bacterium]
MLIDASRHRTFKALVEYYGKTYSTGQIANQLCDVMDGLSTPVQIEAVQWTMDAMRNMADDKAFWKQNCLEVLGEIRSAAVSYFERQKVDAPDDVVFDIVQAVVLNFAVKPSNRK